MGEDYLSGLQSRAGGSGQPGFLGQRNSQGRRRHRRREPRSWPSCPVLAAVASTVPVSAAKWPRPARSWRTPTAGEHRDGQRAEDAVSTIGIDVWEVIDAAKTKPFGFQAFYPGPGLGGHCIPIDPFYLSWVARKHGMPTRFIELAGEINTSMPTYVVDRLCRGAERRRQADPRQQDRRAGRGLQERRGRSAGKPLVQADGAAAGNAARC